MGRSEWQSGNAASLVTALEQLSSGPRRGCGERGRGDWAAVLSDFCGRWSVVPAPPGLFPHPVHHLVVFCSLVVVCLLSLLWAYPWAVARGEFSNVLRI